VMPSKASCSQNILGTPCSRLLHYTANTYLSHILLQKLNGYHVTFLPLWIVWTSTHQCHHPLKTHYDCSSGS
jgi:hypothetical protein